MSLENAIDTQSSVVLTDFVQNYVNEQIQQLSSVFWFGQGITWAGVTLTGVSLSKGCHNGRYGHMPALAGLIMSYVGLGISDEAYEKQLSYDKLRGTAVIVLDGTKLLEDDDVEKDSAVEKSATIDEVAKQTFPAPTTAPVENELACTHWALENDQVVCRRYVEKAP